MKSVILFLILQSSLLGEKVYVGLPLNIEQTMIYEDIFQQVKELNADGVIMDIFWGEVETSPQDYDFSKYIKGLERVKQANLKV